ncbi:MAG: YfhO family protein, partial [Ruminococcus sp.]|nr:YfhO family protein [Ruminococcus sp.]
RRQRLMCISDSDIEQLKQHQFIVDTEVSNDRYLEGTVNIAEGQMLFTTIPYEDGWTLKIDGKKANNLITEIKNEDGTVRYQNNSDIDTGTVIALESTIGLKLPAGEHTITMKYTPPGFNLGMFTLILGIGIIVLFYMYDKKNNEVLIAIRKEKENPESATNEESGKKKVQIIKTKGAVAEQELVQKKPDNNEESDDDETDQKDKK